MYMPVEIVLVALTEMGNTLTVGSTIPWTEDLRPYVQELRQ